MEVIERRIIKCLYYDCGWKNISEYKCNVCYHRERTYIPDITDGNYEQSRPLICQHIIDNHPEYCIRCPNIECEKLFACKKDLKKHIREQKEIWKENKDKTKLKDFKHLN